MSTRCDMQFVSANGKWQQAVASVPTGNNMVKSLIIYTEKEKEGICLINYISIDGSSVTAPTNTEKS